MSNYMQIDEIKKGLNLLKPFPVACDPSGDRTLGPQIKSLLLYQLS